jgi:hypothetical protein
MILRGRHHSGNVAASLRARLDVTPIRQMRPGDVAAVSRRGVRVFRPAPLPSEQALLATG